jgi:carbamate kinase
MRILVALGGNALLERGEKPDASIQREHVRVAAEALAPLATEHELILTHGNGPQVGVLALESAADPALSRPYPLDVLGAQTQGMIGYWLAQELCNAGVKRPIVAMVTQTVVDPTDSAFGTPTKFIGPVYSEADAQRLAGERGWAMARDGVAWRRVVPSPQPLAVPEIDSIRNLSRSGVLVICGGGGGVPVVRDASGCFTGVEAVVDKDLCAAHLATELEADRMLLLTDVPAVMRDFGTPDAEPIHRLGLAQLPELHLPAGSMGPKVEACARFTAATGNPSAIGSLRDAVAVIDGRAGTTVVVP